MLSVEGNCNQNLEGWGLSDHPSLGCRKDSKLEISLDENDSSEQPTVEHNYFLQPLYLLRKHHILKQSFLILRSFAKAVKKKKKVM